MPLPGIDVTCDDPADDDGTSNFSDSGDPEKHREGSRLREWNTKKAGSTFIGHLMSTWK